MHFLLCLLSMSSISSIQVCNPAYLVPVPSQDKLGRLQQEGYPVKNWGDDGGGGIDGLDGVASSLIVNAL